MAPDTTRNPLAALSSEADRLCPLPNLDKLIGDQPMGFLMHGDCRLFARRLDADGSLANRRVWTDLDDLPDGICLDAEQAIWYADVPNKRCVRVREGGEVLQAIASGLDNRDHKL